MVCGPWAVSAAGYNCRAEQTHKTTINHSHVNIIMQYITTQTRLALHPATLSSFLSLTHSPSSLPHSPPIFLSFSHTLFLSLSLSRCLSLSLSLSRCFSRSPHSPF